MAPPLLDRARTLVRSPRFRRVAAWTAGLLLAFGAAGFLAAPPLLKPFLEEKLGEALHRKVSIGRLAINPYALSAEVAEFSARTDNGREVAGFDRLYVNVEASSLFRGGPVVREVRLEGPRVSLVRLEPGRYDISDLIDEWSKPSDGPTPRFAVTNITVSGGKLSFDDRPAGVTHQVTDLALALPFVSSLPYQHDIFVEPRFSATVNGAPLALEGRSKPFSESHESELRLDLDRFDLVRYLPYSPLKLPFALQGGTLDSELKLVFRQDPDHPATLQLTGALHLRDLQVKEADGRPLLAWKQLDVAVKEADPLQGRVAIESVHLAGVDTHTRVDAQGRINWLELAQRLAPSPAKPAAEGKPLAWSVGEIRIDGGTQHWRDESRGKAVEAAVTDVQLTVRRLDGPQAKEVALDASAGLDAGPGLQVKQLAVKGAAIDLAQRRAHLGEVVVDSPELRLVRDRKGQLDLPTPPLLKAADPGPAGPAWEVSAQRLGLSGGTVRYEEQGIAGSLPQVIDGIAASLSDFSTSGGKPGRLEVSARINQKGALKVAGSLQPEPLAASLDLDVTGFPLLPVQPFFAERLNVALVRGQVSTRGKLLLETLKDGLGGGFKGQVTLGDLHAIDKANSTDLLKWKSLFVGGIDARLEPFALNVGEVALSDFYARMIVTPEGRLNLTQLVRQPGAPAPVVTAQAPGKATAVVPPKAKEPPPIRIGKVTFQGGTVNFSDYFVKPNYTANVTRVGGRINGLSSAPDTLADLELRGTYGSAAPVEVTAKLNPLAAKTYLDLKGEVRGVDLTTLSTYAGKYAGYAIDEGKLSLFVTYKLDHNQLTANNRVFLDRLTFGERVDSPDATSLPVKLAVALLKNGRGEIDVNLPISGSLDDPEFSVGGVVVRVIVNLFVKAVTSPFTLLGSLFGGGEELSSVDFDPGFATLQPAAVKKLEALSRAMADRPALKLEITGRADPATEREGLKRAALERTVKAEKLKALVKKGVEAGSVESIELAPGEYPTYLRLAYKEAKFPKPRNLIGLTKDLPAEEMEKLMLANLPAGDEELHQLAARRAEAVQGWLVEQGKVPVERVFLLPPKVEGAGRVEFSLR